MRPPDTICLETSSLCNRQCPTCIRNSHPDRKAVQSWFEPNFMAMEIIEEFGRQYIKQGFKSYVCLCFYNEPLMDERITDIAKLLKNKGIEYIYLVTNGDLLTEGIAKRLDGVLDRITVSIYADSLLNKKLVVSLFNKTKVWIKGKHLDTHFKKGATPLIDMKCRQQRSSTRLIINHRCQYTMCCDDLTGIFDLGTFPEIDLTRYWFGKKHTKIVNNLLRSGGRKKYSYCSTCPRIW